MPDVPPRSITLSFSFSKMCFSTCSSTRKFVSPTSLTRTRRSIWRTMTSMCLSLMRDALEPVDLLDLVHELGRELLLALHPEDVVRVRRAVLQRLARRARGHPAGRGCACPSGSGTRAPDRRARARLARRRDEHLALALGVLAERDLAVDLADDRVVLRLAGLEQLGDAGQTAGDVLRLRGLARDLRDDLAGLDEVAVLRRRCSRRPGAGSAPRARCSGA